MGELLQNGVVRSACGLCYNRCGIYVHVKDGKIVKVEGDPESPHNRGELCVKGESYLDYVYHPDRLTHPLKRVGPKGAKSQWQRICWDEALDMVAKGLQGVIDKHGVETVLALRGGLKSGLADDCLGRFANALGTPNITSSAPVCFVPQIFSEGFTYGFKSGPDYDVRVKPGCTINWGANAAKNHPPIQEKMNDCLRAGMKLIVVDPIKTDLAARADIWLQLRPCTDLALAMGLIHVIINEELYDKAFVEEWTLGFEPLRKHVQAYTPERVQEITWVDAELIRAAARLYATSKPASIYTGNAIDNSVNCYQNGRAISILRALTGNVGVKGGDIAITSVGLKPRKGPQFDLRDLIPVDVRKNRISMHNKLLPMAFYALPQDLPTGYPYPFKGAYIQGANPLLTHPYPQDLYEALKDMDFVVTTELFMTPTALMSDVVLPVASCYEYDEIRESENNSIATVAQVKIVQIGECWSDRKILNELAKRMDLKAYAWEHEDDLLEDLLSPKDMSFAQFSKVGTLAGEPEYDKFRQEGFKTPTQKVELFSERLQAWGFDALPVYYELPETLFSEPEHYTEHPLIMTTCKQGHFWHSAHKQIPYIREKYPDPLVLIHPDTAAKLGIADGEWVHIGNTRGTIKQKARVTNDTTPRVVLVDYGWWFPEQGKEEEFGWRESNVSLLLNNKGRFCKEMGSATMKGIGVKVYKDDPSSCTSEKLGFCKADPALVQFPAVEPWAPPGGFPTAPGGPPAGKPPSGGAR